MQSYSVYSFVLSFFIAFVLLTPGIVINLKHLRNLKQEERKEKGKILQKHMKYLSIAQIVFWPGLFLVIWLVKLDQFMIFSLDPCLYHQFGIVIRFSYYVFRLYVGFHSVLVAIFRVSFIVYDRVILLFGTERFGKLMHYGSILVPFGIVLFAEGTIPSINHDQSLSTKDPRCNETYTIVNASLMETQSPLYVLIHKNVPSDIIICVKLICYTMTFIAISNVVEGILYWHTWSFIIK